MTNNKILIGVGIAVVSVLLFSNFVWADVDICPTFSVSDLVFYKTNGFDRVRLKGCGFTTEEIGKPELPVQSMNILIPPDVSCQIILM